MSFHLYASQSPRLETIDIYIKVDVPKRQDSAQQIPENTDKHYIFPFCVALRIFWCSVMGNLFASPWKRHSALARPFREMFDI